MNVLTLVLDNVRSAQNVGTILRTADAAGVGQVWLVGITPSPALDRDPRPPYVQERNRRLISKTALGAEDYLHLDYRPTLAETILELRQLGYTIAALEQAPGARGLFTYFPMEPIALVVGHEVDGVNAAILGQSDLVLEIPMRGRKESLNVAVATGIALYHLAKIA